MLRVRLIYTLSIQTMFKSLFAAAAAITCCLGNPALASVGDAFDTATHQETGGCYMTSGGHGVCWQSIKPKTYTISLREKHNRPEFATTLLLTCGGKWEAFGPADKQALTSLVNYFCEEQGHG